ncbi:MAG TPA: hypothetical protein VJG32_17980 [Anaerolineae bacterium]|nr:hypothetical protein [Anaerolineae bacterium]
MAYCDAEGLQNLMGMTFDEVSQPPIDEVEDAITNIAGEIDGVLEAAGYALPVAAEAALSMLEQYNKFGAGARVWFSAFSDMEAPERVKYWRDSYNAFLQRIKAGTQKLPGEDISGEEDIAFDVAPHPARDGFWLTGQD